LYIVLNLHSIELRSGNIADFTVNKSDINISTVY
jgi:hypothetical protein